VTGALIVVAAVFKSKTNNCINRIMKLIRKQLYTNKKTIYLVL
jgi:hypothetical protein